MRNPVDNVRDRSRGLRQHHRTVDRISAILDAAARASQGISLSELAVKLDAPVSSIQSLVNGLAASSFLLENHKRFTLGPAPYALNLMAGRRPIQTVQEADLDQLAKSTGNTVLLGIQVGEKIFYIYRTGPVAVPRLTYIVDTLVPGSLIGTTAGRVFLAFMNDRERNARLSDAAIERPSDVDSFLAEMKQIKTFGFATGTALCDPECASLAAPVFEEGQVRAAVTISGRAGQIESQFKRLGRLLTQRTTEWQQRL